MKRLATASLALLCTLLSPFPAVAQPFPSKPVTLIVPVAPGGICPAPGA